MRLKRLVRLAAFAFVFVCLTALDAGTSETAKTAVPQLTAESCRGLALRCIGPTLTSGRIADVAMDPRDNKVWYVAAAAGGLWKTTDGGTSFQPLTDEIGSFSMGCVTLDPNNPDIVWLGTGEQQSQRSVDFGDGVYKSSDAGKTWKNMGLARSEHIARIRVDPRNSDVVYVAAQGPLWAPGGDRGVFKTTDGGKTWEPALLISETTGVTDLVLDPRNPDILYAAAFQRRRNLGVGIAGGPESAIYKSEDGGAKWTKLTNGLPTVDMGRIALAVSWQHPDIVYAQIAASGREGGFFRSDDKGANWKRVNNLRVSVPMYYGEIYADPLTADRVYVMDINIQMSEDGGNTFKPSPFRVGHTDFHSLAFDLRDANHVVIGQDGGLFETKDGAKTFRHFPGLTATQFYRLAVDNALPFYNVYGGAQDNYSQGGPSRTVNSVGIRTADWKRVGGGDGMQPRVDPEDPKVIYAMMQSGGIQRGGRNIRPRGMGGEGVRWNWDSPFIISPHSHTRLYLAANLLYRSDDRGDTWKTVSPDLTRQLDRNKVLVMGKLWGSDAVGRHQSTTPLSVCNALDESPLQEGLLYVGTDDGLVQVTEDGGKRWRKIDAFPGVPKLATVSDVCPSQHNVDTVYASFHNYQAGDFKPYLLKSTDKGHIWSSIVGNLPDPHFIWSIVEDPVNENLLFAGTEFGLFFTIDGGKQWVQLKGGVPPAAFRDLAIQKREADLVCATFGRGIFILDDITPLQHLTPDALAKEAVLFPLRKTYVYEEKTDVKPAADHSDMPNPPFGTVFTYYLRDDLPIGMNSDVKIVLTVTDASGKKLRQFSSPTTAGLHRVTWDLRPEGGVASDLVKPGKYRVALGKQIKDAVVPLGKPQEFDVVPLESIATKN